MGNRVGMHVSFEGDEGSGRAALIQADLGSVRFTAAELALPAALTLLAGKDPYHSFLSRYSTVSASPDGFLCAAEMHFGLTGRASVHDVYRLEGDDSVVLKREILVTDPDHFQGVRTDLFLRTERARRVEARDLEYLAGSAFYRHLDPDQDGVPDTHSTFSMAWCEDKLPMPAVMFFDPARKFTVALARADLPGSDPDILPHIGRGERFFVSDTRMGSLGFIPLGGSLPGMALRAHFPSYEGPQCFSIDRSGSPWGRFAEARAGARFEVSWLIRVGYADDFPEAAWDLYTYLMKFYRTTPPRLPYNFEEANESRIDVLDRFYTEWDEKDGTRGAAYVLNFHPDEGTTLAQVVEYGFTGRTATNAYVNLRHSAETGNARLRARAVAVMDFYVRRVAQPNGFVYGVYLITRQEFVCWWSGITLPCAFSTSQAELATHLSEEMAGELWPLAQEMKDTRGNFTRAISEDVFALLECFEFERARGAEHPEWRAAAVKTGEFFLKIQNADGSWYRAVDTDGNPVRVPEHWFGRTENMRKSGTYTIPVLLVRLFEVTGTSAFMEAAIRGADFLRRTFGAESYYYGSLLDAPHGNMLRGMGPIFDNTTPLVAMELHLRLYQHTSDRAHLDAAIDAARIACTWINIWDVPFPEGSTLHRYGLKSTGFSAVDIAVSSFQNDMMPLYWVRDWLKLAELTGDEGYFTVARIIQYGAQQMLFTKREMYGYAYPGVQNEGRHLSWFLAKEWTRPFGFGRRGKGEENKTFYGWVAAVPLAGYYRVLDEYGTVDFEEIHRRLFPKKEGKGLRRGGT
jgi:hypothetical protein